MLSKSIKSVISGPFLRLKAQEKPEFSADFYRQPYGGSPIPITGMWKVEQGHGFDYGSEQYDYEDHSKHLLHQRYSIYRWFWVVGLAWCLIPYFYFVWVELPFHGTWFGIYDMDLDMNAIKYVNNDEKKHDWDALKKRYDEMEEEEESWEQEEEEDELITNKEVQEAEKNENSKKETEEKANKKEVYIEEKASEQSNSSSDETSSEEGQAEAEEDQSSSSECESSEESS